MSINPLSREPMTFYLFYRREPPMQALASGFFSGASGTIVSGPAHFASTTSSPHVSVHIHRTSQQLKYNLYLMRIKSIEPSANLMNTGELSPTVRTEEFQTFRNVHDQFDTGTNACITNTIATPSCQHHECNPLNLYVCL